MAIPVLEDRGDGAHTARFCFDCVKTILHTGV